MKYKKNINVIVEPQEDFVVFFDTERGIFKRSNTVGYQIWCLCDGKHDHPHIIKSLLANYPNVDPKIVTNDVDVFLRELLEASFLTLVSEV